MSADCCRFDSRCTSIVLRWINSSGETSMRAKSTLQLHKQHISVHQLPLRAEESCVCSEFWQGEVMWLGFSFLSVGFNVTPVLLASGTFGGHRVQSRAASAACWLNEGPPSSATWAPAGPVSGGRGGRGLIWFILRPETTNEDRQLFHRQKTHLHPCVRSGGGADHDRVQFHKQLSYRFGGINCCMCGNGINSFRFS